MNTEPFRKCKGILFDFGGTLDSDGEHWLDRFYELFGQWDPSIPFPEIKRAFYHADGVCCADSHVNSLGLRPLMELHVSIVFEGLNLDNAEKEKEFVDAFCTKMEKCLRRNARLLERLKTRYHLGVVSNFYGNVNVLCQEAGLAGSVDVILDSVQVGMSKPEPEIFQAALEELALPSEQVIFVGDSYDRDMIPAQKLGMKTIWLKGPNPRIPPHAGPVDGCISSLTELEELLQ